MKYYIVAVGITNGIPDIRVEETDTYSEMGDLLSKYHKRGFHVAAFLGEQIQLNKDVTHGLLRGTIQKFADLTQDEFTSDFIDGEQEGEDG